MVATKPDLWKLIGTAIGTSAITAVAALFGVATWSPDVIRPDPAKGSELDKIESRISEIELRFEYLDDQVSENDLDTTRQFIELRDIVRGHQDFRHPPQDVEDRLRDVERFIDRHDHPDADPRR